MTQIDFKRLKTFFLTMSVVATLGSGWYGATYSLFLDSFDLSYTQMMSVNVLFWTILFLAEPFTGPLGDKIGQKKIYLIGIGVLILSYVVYFSSSTYWGFLLAEAIGAFAFVLKSQALETWIRNITDPETTHEITTKTGTFSRLAAIPSTLLGSILASYFGLSITWLFAGITAVIALVIGLSANDLPDSNSEKFDFKEILDEYRTLSISVKEMFHHQELSFIGIYKFATNFFFMPLNMYWSLIFAERFGGETFIGTIAVVFTVMLSIGSYIARKFSQGGRLELLASAVVIGVSIASGILIGNTWVLLGFFLLHEICRGFTKPLEFTYSNRHIENYNRFTLNSLMSSMGTFGGALGLLAFGVIADLVGLESSWLISGLGLAAYGLTMAGFSILRRNNISVNVSNDF